jgi:hypothetical protein
MSLKIDAGSGIPPHREGIRHSKVDAPRVVSELTWILAGTIAAVVVWRLQAANRAPLVWDEAARVDAGAGLANLVWASDPAGVWQWIHSQLYYPFFGPALNGIALMASKDQMVAAWAPAVLAFGLAGILAGRLATLMGGGATGAWCAAALAWTSPIFARVSGGAWTEPIGACLVLAVVIALVNMERQDGYGLPVVVGLLVALCWFLKYDYGLLALGALGLTGLVAVATGNKRLASLKRYGLALGVTIGTIAAWLSVNFPTKITVVLQFAGHVAPDTAKRFDFAYYPTALFSSGEVGVAPLIAVFLVISFASAALQFRRREIRAPLICLALWYVMYSLAGSRYARYFGMIVPLMAAFGGLAAGQICSRAKFGSIQLKRATAAVAGLTFGALLLLQGTAIGTGSAIQFWFLQPNASASAALLFASSHLRPEASPTLMLGQTIAFSSYALHVSWTQRLGRLAPPIDFIGENGQPVTSASLLRQISDMGVHQIVGVDIKSGSSFDTADYRVAAPSQPRYVALAKQLEAAGTFTRAASLSLENGLLEVVIWHYGSATAERSDATVQALTGRHGKARTLLTE